MPRSTTKPGLGSLGISPSAAAACPCGCARRLGARDKVRVRGTGPRDGAAAPNEGRSLDPGGHPNDNGTVAQGLHVRRSMADPGRHGFRIRRWMWASGWWRSAPLRATDDREWTDRRCLAASDLDRRPACRHAAAIPLARGLGGAVPMGGLCRSLRPGWPSGPARAECERPRCTGGGPASTPKPGRAHGDRTYRREALCPCGQRPLRTGDRARQRQTAGLHGRGRTPGPGAGAVSVRAHLSEALLRGSGRLDRAHAGRTLAAPRDIDRSGWRAWPQIGRAAHG